MCRICLSKPQSSAGAGPADAAWQMFTRVLTFPARLQGYLLNAVVNTIDKVQTDQILRETREIIEKENSQASPPRE